MTTYAKKLINHSDKVLEDMFEGIQLSHPNLLRLEKHNVLVRKDYRSVGQHQVVIITGGGSGHEPAHAGFIGEGLVTASVCGGVFASPSSQAVLDTLRTVCGPAGCLLVVKNYTGDRINFGVAAEQAKSEGHNVAMVIVGEDVAVNAGEEVQNAITGRRGLSGTLFVHKVAGAAAASGCSLEEVRAEAEAAAASVGSMGVALSTCTLPGGRPSDRIGPGECEVGLGIHGEPGRAKQPVRSADEMMAQLVERILEVQPPRPASAGARPRVALMVNNLGGSSVMELYISARSAHKALTRAGVEVARVYTGTFMTSLEMAGVTVTVLSIDSLRLARLDAPTTAPAWPRVALEPGLSSAVSPTVPVAPAPSAAEKPPVMVLPESEGEAIRRKVEAACRTLVSLEGRLEELDRRVGDGDCGATFRRAAEAVLAKLPAMPVVEPDRLCSEAGGVVREVMGGTSGAILDIMLSSMAASLRDKPNDWRTAISRAVEGASFYGGAREGCRTMLDALIPAAREAAAGKTLAQVAAAAEAGAEATAAMPPLAGRSSYLRQEDTDGIPDPGAVAAAAALQAIYG
uniref:Dihydroxyacetone kinase n=1 Tax=Tetraselmis sp. GSL018 TaxID=582737 RepID=A0A061S670_9CHLO